MDANRDFLFGVLAVQSGYIDAARLENITREWTGDPNQSLVQLLVEKSYISADQLAALNLRISEILDQEATLDSDENREDAGGTVKITPGTITPGTMVTNANGVEETSESDREDLGSDARATAPITPGPHAPTPGRRDSYVSLETADTNDQTRNRYTLTREHGRGGLGCVWLARDSILHREVALKEVLPGRSQNKLRFKKLIREAQITGQLEHPNIVPVYELSPDKEATPFYTMRFLRGATLGHYVKEYTKRRKDGSATQLDLRKLLDAFISICHAIGYAHSRNIIHRDLKPGNVMLGDFGEVVVVDWGLARKLTDPKEKNIDLQEVVFTGEESHTSTREGQALGTPAYMAPEQANGHVSLTDELTDIYGLGTILFSILTGKPPHVTTKPAGRKESTEALLRRVVTLPTPRIRSVNPSAPSAIDAICAKAMARLRSDRYRSAEELANDVQRWLADEPVSAYQESATERMFRFLRKHRTYSLAIAAVLLISAVAGTTVAVVSTNASHRVAESLEKETLAHNAAVGALQSEQLAKQLALEQFRRAQDAIDRSLSGVSEVMTVLPGTDSLRTDLLRAAAEDYEELVSVSNGDPQLQREAARTRIRLADLRRMMNDFSASEQQYLRAEQDFTSIQNERDGDPSVTLDLALLSSKLALLHATIGQSDEASKRYDESVKAYSQSFDDPSLRLEAQIGLAGARLNYASMLRANGQSKPSLDALTLAEKEFENVVAEHDDLRGHEGLAMARREIGSFLQSIGESENAIEKLSDAESEYRRLVAADDASLAYLEGLANTRMLLANALRVFGDDEAPLRIYRSSVNDYVALLKVRPGIPKYRQSVAAGRVNIAQMLYTAARSRDAKVYLDDAVAELIDLSQTYPQVAVYREAKAHCLATLAMVLRDLNEDDLTETAFAGSDEAFRWLYEDFPDRLQYRGDLGISLMGWGRAKQKSGDLAEAESLYKDAIDSLEFVIDQSDSQVSYRDGLAWCNYYLAKLYSQQNKSLAALPFYKRALSIRDEMPDLPQYRRSLISLLCEPSEVAIQQPDRAVELAMELCNQVEDNPDFRHSLAVACLASGDHEVALREASAAVELRNNDSPFDYFVLAIAEQKNGHNEAAVKALEHAKQLMDAQCPGRIELVGLRRQADELLQSTSSDQDSNTE